MTAIWLELSISKDAIASLPWIRAWETCDIHIKFGKRHPTKPNVYRCYIAIPDEPVVHSKEETFDLVIEDLEGEGCRVLKDD